MDSSHLLTHVNAVGCTLERRESSTCGRSLISPLLCQGNEDEQTESIERAVTRTWRSQPLMVVFAMPANERKEA